MSKLTYQQRGNQNTRIPVGQRRTAGGKALEDNRAAFAAKQLKQGETAQLTKEEDELLKGKSGTKQLAKKDEEETGQAKFSDRGPPVQREEQPAKPNNTGLPDNLKNGIESLSGMSMDNVKVHYNSAKPQQLNALAYAQGTDIHVGPGQEQHLPHEAWHVVQQAQGRVKPTMQMKDGVPVNDNKSLEHEADVMGKKALSSSTAQLLNQNNFQETIELDDSPIKIQSFDSGAYQLLKPPDGAYASEDEYRVWYSGDISSFTEGEDPGTTGIGGVSGYDARVEILKPDNQVHYSNAVAVASHDRGLHKGHILSKACGGSGDRVNIFAQDGGQNTAGKWVSFERNMSNKIGNAPEGSTVRFEAELFKEIGGSDLEYGVDLSEINSRE